MSLILFAQNLLEATTSIVTVSPAALAAKPLSRLYDRDKSPQYQGGSAVQTDIDIDLAAATAVTGWGFVNHTITGVTVTLYGDSFSPPTTSRDSFSATAVDILRTFASLSLRYWRIRIPAMASAPAIGELLLGVPRTVTLNPSIRSTRVTVANVRRDRSPGGYVWATQRGSKRIRLPYHWDGLSDADVATLEAAFDEINQGAKNLLVQDAGGTLRWVSWTDEQLVPAAIGGGNNEMTATFEEAL